MGGWLGVVAAVLCSVEGLVAQYNESALFILT